MSWDLAKLIHKFCQLFSYSWAFPLDIQECLGLPSGSAVKNLPVMQEMRETLVQSLGREDPLEGGHSNPLQYSCLENPVDRGAWRGIVHGVAKSRIGQTWLSTHAEFYFFISSLHIFSFLYFTFCWASLIAQLVKNLPAMQETPVEFLGQEGPLEKG